MFWFCFCGQQATTLDGVVGTKDSPSKVKERSQLEFYHLLQKEKLEIEIKMKNIGKVLAVGS